MRNYPNTPGKNSWEGKKIKDQAKTVLQAFDEMPKTMLTAAFQTGIFRSNICRLVAEWAKSNKIYYLGKGLCPISKHKSGFYTTDASLVKIESVK